MNSIIIKYGYYGLLLVLLILTGCSNSPNPPVAGIVPKELITNGHKRIDNYFWLNERDSPKVIEYLKAENLYAAG
jgi:oligopeptidase B